MTTDPGDFSQSAPSEPSVGAAGSPVAEEFDGDQRVYESANGTSRRRSSLPVVNGSFPVSKPYNIVSAATVDNASREVNAKYADQEKGSKRGGNDDCLLPEALPAERRTPDP